MGQVKAEPGLQVLYPFTSREIASFIIVDQLRVILKQAINCGLYVLEMFWRDFHAVPLSRD